jgi:flagellar hook-basal body complex protein FliE
MANGIEGLGGAGGRLAAQGVEGRGIRMDEDGQGPSFADTLAQALGDVSQLQADAQDAIGAFLRGEPVELHDVMTAAEEAGIALDMLIEIRNKLTEAYRTVMQMQT